MMRSRGTRLRRRPSRHDTGGHERLLAGALLAVLGAVGCSGTYGPERDDLGAARERWVSANELDYSFEFRRSCFCDPNFTRGVRIEVLGGVVSSTVFVDTLEPVTDPALTVTVDDLFDEVRAAIDNEAFSIVAEYDAAIGVPLSVSIDFIENAADDEMAFTTSSFVLLDTAGS